MRKGFIRVIPTDTLRLNAAIRIPKYLNQRLMIEFEIARIGDMNDYFIDLKGERHWLTAKVTLYEGTMYFTSEVISSHLFYTYRLEYNKLFYSLIKAAKAKLKEA